MLGALLTLLTLGAGPTDSPSPAVALDEARAQVQALKFADAAKSLKAIAGLSALTQLEALEFYRLDGLVRGSLNDEAGATQAFTRALSIDPKLALAGKYAPRVTTPFLEARSWVKEHGAIKLEFSTASEGRNAWAVNLQLNDPAPLGRKVRLTIDEDGQVRTVDSPATSVAMITVRGELVKVDARLVGDHDWILASALLEVKAAPLELPKKAAVVEPPPVATTPPVELRAAPTRPSLAPPVVVLVTGVAAAAVGGVFLGVARGDADRIATAPSLVAINELANEGKTMQTLGFALLAGGGAVAAAGAIWLGAAAATPTVSVAVTPSGAAVAVSGSFP